MIWLGLQISNKCAARFKLCWCWGELMERREVSRYNTALHMIREVVEQHAPPASVPSEEMVEPPFVKDAEVRVTAILAIAAKRTADIPGASAPSTKQRKADIVGSR